MRQGKHRLHTDTVPSRHGSFMQGPGVRRVRQRGNLTRRVAAKLFTTTFLPEGQRMLFIAGGLFLALVAADLLDLSARKTDRREKA
jgi:hypothetical protein